MSSLVVASRAGAVTKQTNELGTSRSSAGISWTEVAPMWHDHPTREAPDAGVLAGTVIALKGIRSSGPSSGLQTRLGFRAYRNRLVIVRFERTVRHTPEGRYRPVGGWEPSIRVHESVSMPVRTSGLVPMGKLQKAGSGSQGSDAMPPTSREHRAAVDAETYLPAVVQRSLSSGVPGAETHVGSFLLIGVGSRAEQQINVLRLAGPVATVVLAVRPDQVDAPWMVQEFAYRLKNNSLELGR